MKRFWHFVLSNSFFVSLCAGAMTFQTYQLLNLTVDYSICIAISLLTLSGYNLYWLISKQHFGNVHFHQLIWRQKVHASLFLLASIAALILIIPITHIHVWIGVTALFGMLYALPLLQNVFHSLIFKIGAFKTILLAIVWTMATVVVPFADKPFNAAFVFFCLHRFTFIFMLNIIFDVGDATQDRQRNVHSLVTDSTPKGLLRWFVITMVLYVLATVALINNISFLQVIVLITMLIPIWVLYQKAHRQQPYHFYYVYTDGLMICSALATYLAGILEY